MKHLLKLVIAGIVFAYMPVATAAEWTRITENSVNDKFFIDKSSIQRSGPFIWYWEYREFPQANNAILEANVNQPVHGAVMRWSLDCTNKSQRLRKINAYTTSRKLIQKFEYGEGGMLLQPKQGSSAYNVMNYVCNSQAAEKPSLGNQPAVQKQPQ